MSSRSFPLKGICLNLYHNVKNYRPSCQRPFFISLNHPFCTNSQLLDSSISNWIKKTSKDIPTKIFNHIKDISDEKTSNNSNEAQDQLLLNSISAGANSTLNTFSSFTRTKVDDPISPRKHVYTDEEFSIQMQNLVKDSNYSLICQQIADYKAENIMISPNILRELFEKMEKNTPKNNIIPTQCEIELAKYRYNNKPSTDSSFYKYIYEKRIPHIYHICQMYEGLLINEKWFQENYIWACYHTDDLDTMQKLVNVYLKNATCNSKTLSYVMSSFTLGCEVEFSKNLFQNIVSCRVDLQPELLENFIYQLIKVGSLFENLVLVLQTWIQNRSLPPPSAKTITLLLKEYYKYGTEEELFVMNELISFLNLSDHYLIKLTHLQANIISNEPNSFKKSISESHITQLKELASGLKSSNKFNDLTIFYYLAIEFFAKYSNIKMIQFVLLQMKKDDIPINEEIFKIIARHYAQSQKFLPLLSFLKDSSGRLNYNDIFLQNLYEGFVKTYPYYSYVFNEQFKSWIHSSKNISQAQKDKYLLNLKIRKIESQLTPYNFARKSLDSKKYDSENWEEIPWKRSISGKSVKFADQINYRINKGFRDILRKGVKPDTNVIEATFRRSSIDNRKKIYEMLKSVRLLSREEQKLNVFELQMNPTKDNLVSFTSSSQSKQLNLNNKLMLSRLLTNKMLFEEAEKLLNNINSEDLDDRSLMVKLNYEMRNYLSCSKFDRMARIIDEFPVNSTILSPYIYKQCCFIERSLLKKLRILEFKQREIEKLNDNSINNIISTKNSLLLALGKLRGLIGDIQVRIDQDKLDIDIKVKEMFSFLDIWISQNRDDRKA